MSGKSIERAKPKRHGRSKKIESESQLTLIQQVGLAIAKQRRAAGLTQATVASEQNIQTETVSRLETGAISPTLERLEQFSKLFNCPIGAFFQKETDAVEEQARFLTELLMPLKVDERKILVNFISEAVRLFKSRG